MPSVDFSPDGGRIVSGSYDGTVRIWDAASGGELQCLTGHEDSVMSVSFSPDGGQVVSGGFGGILRIWHASNGAELQRLSMRGPEVYSVGFSPDGERIVSGGSDGTVRIWDADSPLASAIRIASWRDSSVRFSPMVHLLCCNKCYQRSGIKPRQVQFDQPHLSGSG